MIWLRNTSIDPSALIDEARARSTGRFKSDPAASASKKHCLSCLMIHSLNLVYLTMSFLATFIKKEAFRDEGQ